MPIKSEKLPPLFAMYTDHSSRVLNSLFDNPTRNDNLRENMSNQFSSNHHQSAQYNIPPNTPQDQSLSPNYSNGRTVPDMPFPSQPNPYERLAAELQMFTEELSRNRHVHAKNSVHDG